MRQLPPLSALRSFDATARLGSVTRAAEELSRTHGAVSRQIRSLQDHLGVPLFDKAGAGLRLNAQGQALQAVVSEALDRLEQGWRRVRDEARGPGVHVACSATFATRWLAPRLADFYRAHPEIRVRLSMTSAREMRDEGADLVIAWDWKAFPAADQARAIPLAPVAFGPVCAPGYPIDDVLGADIVVPCRIAHDFTSSAWDQWRDATGRRVAGATEISFPHTHLCIEAALTGLGVALVEQRLIAAELADGRLRAPCGFAPFPQGLVAIPSGERYQSASAGLFIDWLATALTAG
ncbi:LysR family transcriptional regulator [Phenylobacterium sp. 20VBR1]|uniref:LysR family transcriptional regulator n=1 Tax=Phenylobacterium glaciei TaxID=2803784 RepID=A0A941CZX8_9CAUL|nr:LysR substrate-binding domain-containing protein [Phenylobacterium glaciei]MBR7618358.1 LysR family transcriptional regulator [Phenylobacterium glaciei]